MRGKPDPLKKEKKCPCPPLPLQPTVAFKAIKGSIAYVTVYPGGSF